VDVVHPGPVVDELLGRHAGGDPSAFGELLACLREPVHRYLYRCGLPREAREDLLQEIFMRIHLHAHTFVPDRSARAWVFAVAANAVRSHFRHQTSQRRHGLTAATPVEELPGEAASSEAFAQAQQTLDVLAQALRGLPLAHREVVALCCIEGLSQAEAAEILEMPLNTVKTNLRRARFALAKALASAEAGREREVAP
jgi:RNA polymerase sigma factor (sigma-70 family)